MKNAHHVCKMRVQTSYCFSPTAPKPKDIQVGKLPILNNQKRYSQY